MMEPTLLDALGRRNRKHADRVCDHCGTLYRPRRPQSKYCSLQCTWANNKGNPGATWRNKKSAGERFWAQVAKTDTCWLWTGHKQQSGHGRFQPKRNGPSMSAFRFAWEELFGEVPNGFELDHLCRRPACVNPDHLEPVTHAENIRRAYAANRKAS